MKRRLFFIAVLVIMVTVCLSACGSSGKEDNTSDADITSSWKLIEITVSGKTERYDQFSDLSGRAPEFYCSDGKNFTFKLNGKTHTGTLTESNGVYSLDMDDSDTKVEAVISGNKLTISMKDGAAVIVFEAK